ncbi:MAG: hypothetical protein IKZ41_11835, partial [Clostridia bacterium]|nr:hypothetical protein [Clostridia bacterium]
AARDDAVRQNIERSMIQVGVLRSFWRYRVIESHRENLTKVLCGVLRVEPEDETVKIICDGALRSEEEAYVEENRRLQVNMMDLGVYFLTEGNSMKNRDVFRFQLPVTRW